MLTKDEQLTTSQQFVRHYRSEIDKAHEKIDRLESVNAELLEVCEMFLDYYHTGGDMAGVALVVASAVAKARGE